MTTGVGMRFNNVFVSPLSMFAEVAPLANDPSTSVVAAISAATAPASSNSRRST